MNWGEIQLPSAVSRLIFYINHPLPPPSRKVAQSGAMRGSGFTCRCKALPIEVAALGVYKSEQTILFGARKLGLQEALSVRCRIISLPSLRSQTIPDPADG